MTYIVVRQADGSIDVEERITAPVGLSPIEVAALNVTLAPAVVSSCGAIEPSPTRQALVLGAALADEALLQLTNKRWQLLDQVVDHLGGASDIRARVDELRVSVHAACSHELVVAVARRLLSMIEGTIKPNSRKSSNSRRMKTSQSV